MSKLPSFWLFSGLTSSLFFPVCGLCISFHHVLVSLFSRSWIPLSAPGNPYPSVAGAGPVCHKGLQRTRPLRQTGWNRPSGITSTVSAHVKSVMNASFALTWSFVGKVLGLWTSGLHLNVSHMDPTSTNLEGCFWSLCLVCSWLFFALCSVHSRCFLNIHVFDWLKNH